MKKPKSPDVQKLTRSITELDARNVDSLYGLEPVYEPGTGLASLAPEEFVAVRCPYCGERLETRIDQTSAEPAYIEDCEVCCRPIEFSVERDEGGRLLAVKVERVD